MVTLNLADRLELSEGDGLELVESGGSVLGSSGSAVATGSAGSAVPAGEDNLVRRALALVGRTAHVRLHKRIPAGAGLGGGSADAAAVLRWAGVTDPAAAVELGADVPFCVLGGRARVRGVGELVEPQDFEDVDGRAFTLLTPPFSVSTADVYAKWDWMGGPEGANDNDLEPAALSLEPRLVEWKERLGNASGQTPRLAGSGGTWFVEGALPGEGRVVVRVSR
jgi:4-diphosphocytidyl-2-C-methyl-D-erythritol kinase